MAGDTQSMWDLVAQPDGGVTYQPLCDQRISIPASPRFIFGDATNDVMRRYYSERLSLPVGLFAATGVDLALDSLLMKVVGTSTAMNSKCTQAYCRNTSISSVHVPIITDQT
jgi:hypothetical protein